MELICGMLCLLCGIYILCCGVLSFFSPFLPLFFSFLRCHLFTPQCNPRPSTTKHPLCFCFFSVSIIILFFKLKPRMPQSPNPCFITKPSLCGMSLYSFYDLVFINFCTVKTFLVFLLHHENVPIRSRH